MSGHLNYYLNIPHVAEAFVEWGGLTRGRQFLDGSVHKWGCEVWAGACHAQLDVRETVVKLIAAIAVAFTLSQALSFPAKVATIDDAAMELILDPLDAIPDISFA